MCLLGRAANTGKLQEGITCLLVDLKTPGITISPFIKIDGRHVFNQEVFEDVRVPVEDRVGQEGEGWAIAKYLLGHERSNASWISITKRTLHKLKQVAAAESSGGRTPIADEAFRLKCAESGAAPERRHMT